MQCAQCGHPFIPRGWPATRAKFCSVLCNKRAWYERNKSRVNAQSTRWNAEHRELRLEVQRRWNASARGKRLKQRWRAAHPRVLTTLERRIISARTTSRRRLCRHDPAKRCVCRPPHSGRVECHHRDGNPLNTQLENLEWRCFFHHRSGHGRLRQPAPTLGVRGSSRHRAQTSGRPS